MKEQTLKERIRHIALTEGKVFNQIWKYLTLERLLARLSRSPYKNQFILKGGFLLSRYTKLNRETKDADFLMKELYMEHSYIESAFRKISCLDIEDGFFYKMDSIEPLQLEVSTRFSCRIYFNLTFGKMKDRVYVDVAVGDIVQSKKKDLKLYHYRGKPLFEKSISLQVYPLETIFAEKLEIILSRSATNTRMKDYHDLILLCREKNIMDLSQLKTNIATVFKNRKAKISLPICFSEKEIHSLQKIWKNHQSKLHGNKSGFLLPIQIKDGILEINNWLIKNKIC